MFIWKFTGNVNLIHRSILENSIDECSSETHFCSKQLESKNIHHNQNYCLIYARVRILNSYHERKINSFIETGFIVLICLLNNTKRSERSQDNSYKIFILSEWISMRDKWIVELKKREKETHFYLKLSQIFAVGNPKLNYHYCVERVLFKRKKANWCERN